MKKNDLINGRIGTALLLFVLPLIAGSLIQQLYTTVDAVIVGQFVGKEGLAAIDSVHTLFRFPINFMNGLAAGATIIISRFFGARDNDGLHQAVNSSILVAGVLGVVSSIGGVALTPILLKWMSVPSDIIDATYMYTTIYFVGLWAMILYNMGAGILRALGDSKSPLYILILCSVLNIIGDYILVGVHNTGVKGAAYATVFSQIISAVSIYILLFRKLKGSAWKVAGKHVTGMLKTGFPLALQAMLFPIANTIVQASVNNMGTDNIAAWGICDKMDMLIWLIADAMSPALTTYVAQNMGAKKSGRIKKGTLIGTGMSVVAVAAVSALLFAFPGIIGSWFLGQKDMPILLPLVIKYMRMMAPFFVFYAVAEAFSGACCGLGDTVTPMITTLVTICLLRVVCIFTILPKFYFMESIVWIYIASWITAGGAFGILFITKSKKLKDMEG